MPHGYDGLTVKADTAERVRELRDERETTLDEVVRDALDAAGLLDEAEAMG